MRSTPSIADDAVAQLTSAAAGLSAAVYLHSASPSSFAELEVEKLVYHLISNSCERAQGSLVTEGVGFLGRMVASRVGTGGDNAGGDSRGSFPCPQGSVSSDYARLISGSLLNGIRSAASNKAVDSGRGKVFSVDFFLQFSARPHCPRASFPCLRHSFCARLLATSVLGPRLCWITRTLERRIT